MTTVEATEDVWTDYLSAGLAAGVGGVIEERYGSDRQCRQSYRVRGFDRPQTSVRAASINTNDVLGNDFWIEPRDNTGADQHDKWRTVEVGPDGPTARPITFYEWFSNLTEGQRFYVASHEETAFQYVYWGMRLVDAKAEELDVPENKEAVFYKVSDGSRITYGHNVTRDRVPEGWHVATDDDGTELVCDTLTLKMMTQNEGLINQAEYHEDQRKKAEVKANEYLADLKTLNEKINAYADEDSMCGMYESRIFGWNSDLVSGFKLRGRIRAHSVRIRLPLLFEDRVHYVTVQARSQAEADDIASKWTPLELIMVLKEAGFRFEMLKSEGAVVLSEQGDDLPLFQEPPF